MRPCYALRHVPFESLGLLEPVLVEAGFAVRYVDVPTSSLTAALEEAELIVVLGGPISAYEEQLYPFLTDEVRLLEQRLRDRRATIGICLGAQLLARALGARVYPGSEKEIGWAPLTLTAEGKSSPLGAIDGDSVLHWHGDTFDLPQGAELLASTSVTPHQAFRCKNVAYGLQCHLEVTALELEAWYVGHAAELAQSGRITVPDLRRQGLSLAPKLAPHAVRALAAMVDELVGPASSVG